jgi:diaminopimelate decarboxylase
MNEVLESAAKDFGTPLYLYFADKIRERARLLKSALGVYEKCEFLYAIKANFNPHLVKLIASEGFGVDAVSLEEVKMAFCSGVSADKIMYTENNMTDFEMQKAHEMGILINFNSLYRLRKFGEQFRGSRVCVRFNPNVGAASHATNITGGAGSKFGISQDLLGEVLDLVREFDLKLVGIHQHIGSGWLRTLEPKLAMEASCGVALEILKKGFGENLEFVDFGGGFGIPYKDEDEDLDLSSLGEFFTEKMRALNEAFGREITLKFEPGRFLVAESGVLLSEITAIKKESDERIYLGLDTGMNHLARVAMYGSYHPIEVLNDSSQMETYDVCGNICECADFFAKGRLLKKAKEGDLVAIKKVGAYGMAMANNYQFRSRPMEVLYEGGEFRVIRKRGSFEESLGVFGEI